MTELNFEWDNQKEESNQKKHGISFEEAVTVFGDYLSITISDPLHSENEERLITIGNSNQDRLLVIAHTDRKNKIRIISARKATKAERNAYEEKN